MDRAQSAPIVDTNREVRFALVMYGGVSLAIYMNGVSQELYHLVRATAPTTLVPEESSRPLVPDAELSGTEWVYRKIGQALESLRDSPAAPILDLRDTAPITTRFVIDVLSGTSAGGINAVFLAKALANNQSIDELERLWMSEGDISVLLNDRKSRVRGLTLESPPDSLLNSGRMYAALLDAFDLVGRTNPSVEGCASPFVRELDLWVTTTDLRGVVLPLKLDNGVAFERRHRNVFHFVYGTQEASGGDRNDFSDGNNPMLAFASRCTSAFPFAFRPMLLGDLLEPLGVTEGYRSVRVEERDDWKRTFFGDYHASPDGDEGGLDPERELPLLRRPFADGGALDNKPFTWATGTLLRRAADVPVDRKLIFIEPDPGHPELEATKQERPDVFENLLLQSHSLPRQESIRDDIRAVMDRNRLITRVDRVLQGLAADSFNDEPAPTIAGVHWAAQGIDQGVETHGRGYGAYHRLKVSAVTDDLVGLLASVGGFDEESAEVTAIDYLVRAWRNHRYQYRAETRERPSFNRFLVQFDLQYRLRRLAFLRRRVDALDALNPSAVRVISTVTGEPESSIRDWDQNTRAMFRTELRDVKRQLSTITVRLRFLGRELRSRSRSPLAGIIRELEITRDELRTVLELDSEAEREQRARQLLDGREGRFDTLASELATSIRNGVATPAGRRDSAALVDDYGTEAASAALDAALEGGGAARRVLRRYRDGFEDFDMVALPMLYGTGAVETDVVEVLRISPEDATSIVDERRTRFRVRKTRGWKYWHFGAFLSEEWRRNDILFGRLDAAECLINTLVPAGHADAEKLLSRAQRAIIVESLLPEELSAVLHDDASLLSDEEVVARFRERHKVADDLPPEASLPILGRAAGVAGKMLGGISDQEGAIGKVTGWAARLGSVAAGLVALGTPGSGSGLVFRHVFPLLVAVEVLLAVLGAIVGAGALLRIAALALVLTVGARMLMGWTSAWVTGRRWPARVARVAIRVVALLVLLALVAAMVAGIGYGWDDPAQYWDGIKAFFERLA